MNINLFLRKIIIFYFTFSYLSCNTVSRNQSTELNSKIENIFDVQKIYSNLKSNETKVQQVYLAIEQSAKEKIQSNHTRLLYYHWLKNALNDLSDSWEIGHQMDELIDKHQAENAKLFDSDTHKYSAIDSTHSISNSPNFTSTGSEIFPSIYQWVDSNEPAIILKKNLAYKFEFPEEIYTRGNGSETIRLKWKLKARILQDSRFVVSVKTRVTEENENLNLITIATSKAKSESNIQSVKSELLVLEVDQGSYLRRYFWKVKIVD
jgi:hypothetical protein